ncbi:hypothetical protein Q604_UNBC16278G0001, partial [human gut metagenome]
GIQYLEYVSFESLAFSIIASIVFSFPRLRNVLMFLISFNISSDHVFLDTYEGINKKGHKN